LTTNEIAIRRPDDWHVHLRDGEMLQAVLPYTAQQFARAIVMPNLNPPILTANDALRYKHRICAALPRDNQFEPLMTCYLAEETQPDDLVNGFAAGIFTAAKLYPAHATTNSQFGLRDPFAIRRVLERMEKVEMPLLIHGESTDPEVDIFDRERVFIERVLIPLLAAFPKLKIVLEHITTAFAVDFIRNTPGGRLAATITPHHLMINRNAIFAGGLRPHAYCLPVAKREANRLALRQAATSGEACFFLGTDSAPHPIEAKESACGCAGIFCAPVAMETYAEVFDEEKVLHKLERFASINGANFYGLPLNEGTIVLTRTSQTIQECIDAGSSRVQIFRGESQIPWTLKGAAHTSAGFNAPTLTARSPQELLPTAAKRASSPWSEEQPPHLPCKRGDLPSAVLFPGDPGRLDRFANVMEKFRIIGQNREFRIGVGIFDGVELGVCSTGIGGPSTEIALVEAAELGCRFALRVGGTGALEPSIAVGSILIASEAIRGGGAASFYAPPDHPAKAHPRMVAALRQSAELLGLPASCALIASTDSYYAGQGRRFPNSGPLASSRSLLESYRKKGAVALDMEGESVLVIGERLHLVAGVLLAVHGNRSTDEWLEDFGYAQDRMIRIGCQALASLVSAQPNQKVRDAPAPSQTSPAVQE
jgi:dihydroorotase